MGGKTGLQVGGMRLQLSCCYAMHSSTPGRRGHAGRTYPLGLEPTERADISSEACQEKKVKIRLAASCRSADAGNRRLEPARRQRLPA